MKHALAALGTAAALLASGCGGGSDTSSDGSSGETPRGSDVFVEDDFSDPASGWPKDDDDSVLVAYADDGYRILMKEPGPRDARLTFGSGDEPVNVEAVSVEADATERAGPYTTRGTEEFEFHGVACWGATGESDRLQFGYKFVLTPEGHYGILKDDEGDQLAVLTEGDGDFGGYGATRRIRGECVAGGDRATSLVLYVDERKIADASDPDGPDRFPAIGLTVETSEAGTDVFFDNVLARNPSAPRPSPFVPTIDPFPETRIDTSSAPVSSGLCKKEGIRYSGLTAEGGEACFTLTRNRRTLLEVGYTFVPAHGCPDGASGTRYSEGAGGPALTGDQVRSSGFTGTIKGDEASGVLQDWDICKERTFAWQARRVP